MKRFTSLKDAYPVCAAIGSPVRLEILEQLLAHGALNMDSLAKKLHLTGGALTRHIKILEDAELVKVRTVPCTRGYQKLCSLNADKILIELPVAGVSSDVSSVDMPVGLFSDYAAAGLCGLYSSAGFIGSRDNPKSFLSAERAGAAALWIQKGYITYLLPALTDEGLQCIAPDQNRALRISTGVPSVWSQVVYNPKSVLERAFGHKGASNAAYNMPPPKEFRISLEISPDITGRKDSGGVVSFLLDDLLLGTVNLYSPSEKRRGYLTPSWHDDALPQYGTLKLLRITQNGTFLDSEKISKYVPADVLSAKKFSIASDTGFMLFGAGFGDYNQGLRFFRE